jgi:hypothetical protein
MAEDEETTTARYIAANASTRLMLKILVEIVSSMSDDPAAYRASMKKQALELAGKIPLAPMPATQEAKVRSFVRENLQVLLTNNPPN